MLYDYIGGRATGGLRTADRSTHGRRWIKRVYRGPRRRQLNRGDDACDPLPSKILLILGPFLTGGGARNAWNENLTSDTYDSPYSLSLSAKDQLLEDLVIPPRNWHPPYSLTRSSKLPDLISLPVHPNIITTNATSANIPNAPGAFNPVADAQRLFATHSQIALRTRLFFSASKRPPFETLQRRCI